MNEKSEIINNIESIEKKTNTMGNEYYIIKFKNKQIIQSKYSRLDSIFDSLKEIENDIAYEGET